MEVGFLSLGRKDDQSSDEDDGIIFLSPGDNNRHHRIQKVHRSDIRPKIGLGVVNKDDAWFSAKQAELASIKEHQVWDVVNYSPGNGSSPKNLTPIATSRERRQDWWRADSSSLLSPRKRSMHL